MSEYTPPLGTTTRCGINKAVTPLLTTVLFDGSLASGRARYGPWLGEPAGEPENLVTEAERQQAYQWLEWKGLVINEQAIYDICLGYLGGQTLVSKYQAEYIAAHPLPTPEPPPPPPPPPPLPDPEPPPQPMTHVPGLETCQDWLVMNSFLKESIPYDIFNDLVKIDAVMRKNGLVWIGTARRAAWGRIMRFWIGIDVWGN